MGTALRFQWVIAGALLGLLVRDIAEPPRAEPPRAVRSGQAAPSVRVLVHPRALRAAPGVGRLRALEVSDHAWSTGPPGALAGGLEAIAGVGPRTAEAIRQVLDGDGFPLHSCGTHADDARRIRPARGAPPRAVVRRRPSSARPAREGAPRTRRRCSTEDAGP